MNNEKGGNMDPFTGMMIAQGAGQLGGMLMGGYNDRRQLRQQKELQKLQIAGAKEMGQFNQLQQLEMFNKTGYGAQLQQMKDAGLSVGLMAGKGGAGGQTGAVAPMPTGGNADGGSARLMAQTAFARQLAEIENIKADTKQKEATTTGTTFDNDVRSGIGKEAYQKKIDAELTNAMAKNKNEYRQANALFQAMNEGDSFEVIKDHFGSYVAGNWEKLGEEDAKTLMSSWQRTEADLLKIKQDIESSQQGVKESISKEKLNEIDAKISDFKADLTKLGLNETTTRILELILKAWTAGRRK